MAGGMLWLGAECSTHARARGKAPPTPVVSAPVAPQCPTYYSLHLNTTIVTQTINGICSLKHCYRSFNRVHSKSELHSKAQVDIATSCNCESVIAIYQLSFCVQLIKGISL